jgi:phospholipid/cholesterol/gamma-HCH transport system substrate-binding protein
MEAKRRRRHIHPAWWAITMFVAIIAFVAVTTMFFAGTMSTFVPVTLVSDRSGLVMESGAKVKMRGVQVGRVAAVQGGTTPVSLKIELFPDQIQHIPANVSAQIRATTAFGAKYVDLIPPDHPDAKPIAAGAVLHSRNVSTEVNTVFQNVVDVLRKIDPAKLNAILSAIATGVRGQGERIGEATTDAYQVLTALNERSDTIRRDWQSFKGFSDAYADAAPDINRIFETGSTVATTFAEHEDDLDNLLLNVIGLSVSGNEVFGAVRDTLPQEINDLEPTTNLLLKYNPEYTCLLVGATNWLNESGYAAMGGNGRTILLDTALLLGDDMYRYPQHLPIVAAKGGPGGKPSCGSLPDASKKFPVRQIITNTGWGTGLDVRPNPGIGSPWWMSLFGVTRAVPVGPNFRGDNVPAIGPVPYPGAPAYGAPLYGPGGVPLWPGVPPAPPPPDAAGSEPGPGTSDTATPGQATP